MVYSCEIEERLAIQKYDGARKFLLLDILWKQVVRRPCKSDQTNHDACEVFNICEKLKKTSKTG